jgi:hypothetical protein
MTSGSSSSVMSSGIGVFATGGAIMPVVVGGPMFALPFAALVAGVSGRPHPLIYLIRICSGSFGDDWAVSSSIWAVRGGFFRLITIGGRDGWLSEASGIARLACITLCDYVGVGGYVFMAFSWMYVSKREITSLTLSLIFATFASIVAIALSSCCVDFGGVCVVAASASVRCLFLASRLIT